MKIYNANSESQIISYRIYYLKLNGRSKPVIIYFHFTDPLWYSWYDIRYNINVSYGGQLNVTCVMHTISNYKFNFLVRTHGCREIQSVNVVNHELLIKSVNERDHKSYVNFDTKWTCFLRFSPYLWPRIGSTSSIANLIFVLIPSRNNFRDFTIDHHLWVWSKWVTFQHRAFVLVDHRIHPATI